MEISEIVAQLEARDGHHPREALIEAIARRDEMVPVLLELLESVVEDIEYYADDPDNLALTFALLLLAQWRETRAYPLVVCIFSAPGELPFDLIGDSVTENLGQILASVCGGDLDGI
ncbi:MAG: DUF1186 domain-containing protein, partial [bacterium]|nr:DUF1186 domain-containing protein [bacterium]